MNTRTNALRNCNHHLWHENRLKMAWCNPEKGNYAFKRLLALVILLLTAGLTSACGVSAGDSDKAQQALVTFFEQLNRGDYEEAVKWYGGSYETLISFNPDQDPDDLTGLWENGCQINGLQCLPVRIVTFNERTFKGEYIFTVEFETPDGALFVLEACCGENPTTPPQFQFEYRVVEGGDGQFRVLDMPVYMP